MESELRSGRLIGYLFAIPCSVVALIILFQREGSSGFLMLSLWFGLGAAVGVYLLLNPKTLVRVNNDNLELYPGSLFRNKKQIEIPMQEIEGFDVKTVSDGDGNTWLLSLYLRNPQPITEEAMRWIKASVPKICRDQASDTTILWSLTWPEGGVRGAQNKMKKLIGSPRLTEC